MLNFTFTEDFNFHFMLISLLGDWWTQASYEAIPHFHYNIVLKISMSSLYYHHILATGKLRSIDSNKTSLEGTIITSLMWDNVAEIKLNTLNGYGSKIQKVSRCRPVVSNETILATRQEFFFTKVPPVQGINNIVSFDFWLILLSWIFFLSYPTIYFFVKNFFFKCLFQWIRYSNVFTCFLVEKGAID